MLALSRATSSRKNTVKASLALAIPSAVDPPSGERAAAWPSSTPHRLTARVASARLGLGRRPATVGQTRHPGA